MDYSAYNYMYANSKTFDTDSPHHFTNNAKENIQTNNTGRVGPHQLFHGANAAVEQINNRHILAFHQQQQRRRRVKHFGPSVDLKEPVSRRPEPVLAGRDYRPAIPFVQRRPGKRRKQANPRHVVVVDKLHTEYQEEWEGEFVLEENSATRETKQDLADQGEVDADLEEFPEYNPGERSAKPDPRNSEDKDWCGSGEGAADGVNSSCDGLWNKHTQKKTQQDIDKLYRFLKQRNVVGHIEDFEPLTLSSYFAEFFMQAKKPDGTDYEPNTLRSILASFERYLKGHSYGRSVIHGREFTQARQALKTKQRQLKWTGKERKRNVLRTLDERDTDLLFSKGVIGMGTPIALINAIWWNNTFYFEMRSGTEHRNLKWGDIQLKYDPERKSEFLVYQQRCSVDLQSGAFGSRFHDEGKMPIRIYSNSGGDLSDPKDPVSVYRAYASQRPTHDPDSPFYLAIVKSRRFEQWYSCKPIGVNKLQSYMKSMLCEAGLQWNGMKIYEEPDTDDGEWTTMGNL